ncbi:MAG: hypothetical protein EXR36_06820 [Betaproteobacteria bacterium]|nr:hypothetical protein [Betaproteobacteria bacterium]
MRKLARDPPLAKLSRPKIHRAVPRERLFGRLDRSAERQVSWVAAPPGAGKTALLASYLESRKLAGIWYQLDPDDAEPPAFFYYMSLAERGLRGTKQLHPLPLLTPEYLTDLEGFGRRYFRELFARLGTGAVLVLDNFQDLPTESSMLPLLLQGLSDVPEGVSVLIASRSDPPECAARLAANGMLSVIEWEEIKLTESETGRRTGASYRKIETRRIHRRA